MKASDIIYVYLFITEATLFINYYPSGSKMTPSVPGGSFDKTGVISGQGVRGTGTSMG